MATLEEALAMAMRHHQSGQLAQAEHIYRQILAVEPNQPQTLHLMGLLAMQAKNFTAAVPLIERAIQGDRNQAAFHANLAEALRHLGRLDEALGAYERALRLQPDLVTVLIMQGIVLRTLGRNEEAAASLRGALKFKPDDVEARGQLGQILHEQGKQAEAEACFRRVVRVDGNSADAHYNLGNVLQDQGRFAEAEGSFRAALALSPGHFEAHNNLGTTLKQLGRLDEAAHHCAEAARLSPSCAAAHANLGGIHLAQGRPAEAVGCFRQALAVDPSLTLARHNLGSALQHVNQLDEAQQCFEEVLRVEPNNSLAHLGLGQIFQQQGKLTAAIECCQKTIAIDPQSADAYNNMAVAWADQGRQDEAVANCQKAIELRSNFSLAHGNLAVALQGLGRLEEAAAHHRLAMAADPVSSGLNSNLLYLLNYLPELDAQTIFAEHLAWGRRFADPLFDRNVGHGNDRTPDRRLRIGYVSPHFMSHAVNFFTYPMLAKHDHTAFEVTCYSDVTRVDDTARQLQGMVDRWRDVVGLSDARVAELVREDQIDILIDLTGHISGGKRMLVFARKPAPVQVTYIGYQNTTGMQAMDYRLTDEYSDPPGMTEALHTETLARLPRSFFCYMPSTDAPPVGPLPARANGYVTFGSVNNFTKINARVLDTWARILNRVPNSRLTLRADMTESLRARLIATFTEYGIEASRLQLFNRAPRREYLEMIARSDIALDPFPFNGHTTTCDCLWQGVSVVTLSGETYVSRFGGSGLATLGLTQHIAHSIDEYVDIAVRLAEEVDALDALRGQLRGRMADSPLLDYAGFTRNLEAEYRQMWARYCAK